MWHEARKQERKIRGMLVDYRRRAERRQDFYERIKADPTQFMQVHGRKCKIHLDPAVAMAGDSSTIMMPWQGQSDNIIDRFDARAHLDFIPPISADAFEESPSSEERVVNYERYRILAQNEFLCMSEEKFLQQLYLEEQYGVNAQLEAERAAQKKAQKPQTGAAIGYTYEDSTGDYPSASGFVPPSTTSSASRASPEGDDDSDSDLDVDVCININKFTVTQGHELNKFGRNYGMLSTDFYSFLTRDADEADAMRLAREEEQEKVIMSGRKSRRERRAQREKKFTKRFMSPPSYAAAKEDFSEYIKEGDVAEARKRREEEEDESRSPSPVNSGVITYITSFGGEDETPGPSTSAGIAKANPALTKLQKLKSQLTLGSILGEKRFVPPPPVDKIKGNLDKLKVAAQSKRDKSSSTEIVGRSISYRSPAPLKASDRRRSRSRSPKRFSRSRSRSRDRRRPRDRVRHTSMSSRSSRSRSRSSSRSTASSRGSSRNRRRRSVPRGRSSSRRRRRSSSSSRSSSASSSRSDESIVRHRRKGRESASPRSSKARQSPTRCSKSPLPTKKCVETTTVISLGPPPPPPSLPESVPIKRYYGRKKEDHSDSELSFSDDDGDKDKNKLQKIESNAVTKANTPSRSGGVGSSKGGGASVTTPSSSSLVTKSGESKPLSSGSSSSGLNARDRLKRKMQSLLNKQYKADKKAEIEKTERQLQVQQERNEEMRELAIKLRKRQRELRHRIDGTSGGQSSDENLSDVDHDYKAAIQTATEDEEERLIQARLHKLVAMSRNGASDEDVEPEFSSSSNRRHTDSSRHPNNQGRDAPNSDRRRRESDYSQSSSSSHDYHTKRSRRDTSRDRTSATYQRRVGRDRRSRSRSRSRSSRWDSQNPRLPRSSSNRSTRLVDY